MLGGESGLVQTQDADRGGPGSSGAGFFSQAPLDLMGQRLASLAASSSGEAFAFGDTAGYVHLWSVNDQPTVNAYSRAVEDPPRYAACVERAFERAQYEMARLQLAQAGQPPPPPPDAPLAEERDPAPEAPFHLSEDGGATPPLSYVDPRAEVAIEAVPAHRPEGGPGDGAVRGLRRLRVTRTSPRGGAGRGVPPRGAAAQQARGEPRGRRRGEAQGGDRGEAVHPGWRRARRGGDVAYLRCTTGWRCG